MAPADPLADPERLLGVIRSRPFGSTDARIAAAAEELDIALSDGLCAPPADWMNGVARFDEEQVRRLLIKAWQAAKRHDRSPGDTPTLGRNETIEALFVEFRSGGPEAEPSAEPLVILGETSVTVTHNPDITWNAGGSGLKLP